MRRELRGSINRIVHSQCAWVHNARRELPGVVGVQSIASRKTGKREGCLCTCLYGMHHPRSGDREVDEVEKPMDTVSRFLSTITRIFKYWKLPTVFDFCSHRNCRHLIYQDTADHTKIAWREQSVQPKFSIIRCRSDGTVRTFMVHKTCISRISATSLC